MGVEEDQPQLKAVAPLNSTKRAQVKKKKRLSRRLLYRMYEGAALLLVEIKRSL